MIADRYPLFLAGRALTTEFEQVVTDKYTGEIVSRVARAGPDIVERAIVAAVEAFEQTRRMPAFERQAILEHVVRRVRERHDEFSEALAIEAGKPISTARGEVTRLIDTLRLAAEEATRVTGETLPLDIRPRAASYEGLWRRAPIGPCGFITPFNFPMNLVAHKIGPAIAMGCSWILKPAPQTPIGALLLGEILAETDLPAGAFSILPCNVEDAAPLVEDDRLRLLSFTGSPGVGWSLKARAGRKKVLLELGGNAACIVDRNADLELAAERITAGAFYQSGQSCISVQRVFIHRSVYKELTTMLTERARALKSGNPLDEDTFLGPLISEDETRRVEAWIKEAVDAGARLLCGGERDGRFISATYLENVGAESKLSCVEVFGPVATLEPFDDFDDAIRRANDSRFGLHAGVFTNSLEHALRAYDELDVGGVVINDTSNTRVDNMPYGGVKHSGLGREGIRFAMQEMSEIKLLVFNRIGKA